MSNLTVGSIRPIPRFPSGLETMTSSLGFVSAGVLPPLTCNIPKGLTVLIPTYADTDAELSKSPEIIKFFLIIFIKFLVK